MVVISHGVIRHIEVIQIVEIKIFLFLKRGNFCMGRTIPEKKSKATAVREKTNAVTATKKTNMISLFLLVKNVLHFSELKLCQSVISIMREKSEIRAQLKK